MTIVAEPTVATTQPAPITQAFGPRPQALPRQVMVVVDACSEISPTLAAELGIVVLPRAARVDGKPITLGAEQTLHADCWPKPPRRIAAEPHTLGNLAEIYGRIVADGVSVLALQLPERFDASARVAFAARSILLAGQSETRGPAPRIAVYEVAAVGQSFAFLALAAARGAAAGMALHQISTLLDRLQAALQSYYLTGSSGPIKPTQGSGREPGVGRLGNEQLWTMDPAHGLFVCKARGYGLTPKLFAEQGTLHMIEPTAVCGTLRMIDKINAGRNRSGLPPLEAQPGGLSLMSIFPAGCVELAVLPDDAHIERIIDVIRRIDRQQPAGVRGVRARGGV